MSERAREDPAPPIEIVVTRDEAGERLDKVLAARKLASSRAVLQRWLEEGRVMVDGRAATAKEKARAGSRISVAPAPPPPSRAEPEDIPLAVRYEDAHLLVIDKPAGLVVHPAPGHARGTLVNAVLHRVGAIDAGAAERPGIVHRLDKDTSGLLVVAKTEPARAALAARFAAHDLERRYLAIALGHPPATATYDTLHARHPRDRKRFTTKVRRGKRAVTHLQVRERLHGASLVECRLETGRTHQIRVHLAEHGHPVLADPVYGRKPTDPLLREAAAAIGRQALHAAVLGIVHPVTGETLRVQAPLPADFERALAVLRPH